LTITGHYWLSNIEAIARWADAARRRMADSDRRYTVHPEERPVDRRLNYVRYDELIDLAGWCWEWIEADPGNMDGDPTYRRAMRPHWPEVYQDYLRLRGAM
jgi:hypothetical protein